MKLFLTIAFFMTVSNSQAFFEHKVYGLASNNPLGLVLSAGLAYNQKVWDDSTEKFWMYGYIRPKVAFDTSFLVNTASAEIQVFPISIFGFTLGSNYAYRSVEDSPDFSCDLYNCRGEMHRNYFRVNANLGAGDFVSSLSYQVEHFYNSNDDMKPSVELATLLLIPEENGIQERYTAFFGYKLSDDLSFGVLEMYNMVSGQGVTTKSEGQYLVASVSVDKLKVTTGLGTFGSDYNEKTFSLIVKINWLLDPSLSLND